MSVAARGDVFASAGWTVLDRLEDQVILELRCEAVAMRSEATRRIVPHGFAEEFPDGSFSTESKNSVAPPGERLESLLSSQQMTEAVRLASGIDTLNPTRGSYNYYFHGDFLGVHRDVRPCRVTLLMEITDILVPLCLGTQFRSWSNAQIKEEVRAGGVFPEPGHRLQLPRDRFAMIEGSTVPHWRPLHEPRSIGAIVTMCYYDGPISNSGRADD